MIQLRLYCRTMNDSPEKVSAYQRPLPDPPLSRDEARARFLDAMDELIYAYRVADDAAWREGFHHGWTSYKAWFEEQIAKMRETANPQPTTPHQGNPINLDVEFKRPPTSTRDAVLNFISANPGQKGVQIASALSDWAPERTVRTTLHRLKVAQKIQVVEGRWYVFDAASPNQQGHSQEEDDAAP